MKGVFIDLYNGSPFDEDTEMLTFGPVDMIDVGKAIEMLFSIVTTKPNTHPRALIRNFKEYP